MPAFLVDEDLPRLLAADLRLVGLDAVDVRDVGLRSAADPDIYSWAQSNGRIIVSGDLGFANLVSFPPGTHRGIIVSRISTELPHPLLRKRLVAAIQDVGNPDLAGALAIVEIDRIRIRRLPPVG